MKEYIWHEQIFRYKLTLLNVCLTHKGIQNPDKHLRWSFWQKYLKAFYHSLLFLQKCSILDIWLDPEYTSVFNSSAILRFGIQHFWCSDYSRVRLDQMYVKFCIELLTLIIYEDSLFGRQDQQKYSFKLTHFMPMISFDTPWKHQKTRGFLMFSGSIKRDQWH